MAPGHRMNPADTLSDWNACTIRRGNTMFHLAATVHILGVTTVTRAQDRLTELKSTGDRGSVTLEQVMISLGLFVLAVAVVAGITAAVNSRLAQIN